MFNRRGNGSHSMDFAYNGTKVESTGVASSHTITNVSFGAAHPDRMVVVVIQSSNIFIPPLTCKINGINATIRNATGLAMAFAKVPSGTSGNVVVTYGTNVNKPAIVSYRFNTKATNQYDFVTKAATSNTVLTLVNVACSSPGVVICAAQVVGTHYSHTWNGVDSLTVNSTTGNLRTSSVETTESSTIRDATLNFQTSVSYTLFPPYGMALSFRPN